MIGDESILLWSAAEVARGKVPAQYGYLEEILEWSRTYLQSGHQDLGRSGPVCPYTPLSLRKDLFHLAALPTISRPPDLTTLATQLRDRYERLAQGLQEQDANLLTLLVALPQLDPTDPAALNELQREAKDEFVAAGLMIGQFHPACTEPGLWNPAFHPLRSPIPLLAVRRLLADDFPFLADNELHTHHYLRRFAPAIPARVREQLVTLLTHPAPAVRPARLASSRPHPERRDA
ncbi:hypothetical protein EDD96_6787 [Streptomyces sp. Ag109_G2-6]|uniref:DUF6875 domain-containing protein n=1 Tax=Streptomyces TaxID=1883 RepID=UPI000FC29E02|nr:MULTISPECIES: hypothetical protein [Streptomyces]RPF30195.1 hypothetical protein EDD96_6787 [Streptomyces sp. Ag109_G2-6]